MSSTRKQSMKIKLKGSILATALLSLLSNASVPAAMSKPTDLFTPIDSIKARPIDRGIIQGRDPKQNGMRVRVSFKLRGDEKLVCNEASIAIKIRDTSQPQATSPGGLIGDYPLVREYNGKLYASNSTNATCLYDFTVPETDIGKIADISLKGFSSGGYGSFIGTEKITIKSTRQTLNVKGIMQPPPA
jgi:hypothetical protein